MITKHSDIKVDNPSQILLCNTNRDIKNYLRSLKFRNNGKHKRIPNYVVDKKGKIHQPTTEDVSQHYLYGYRNEGVVIVCLENRGWLKRRSTAWIVTGKH